MVLAHDTPARSRHEPQPRLQRVVMDVVRTADVAGTLAVDIVRGGHFSYASAAAGSAFPAAAPTQGYPRRPLGLAAFGLRQATCWVAELKSMLSSTGLPAILLMFYDLVAFEGHFRVAVGANATGVYFHDPWDRDGPQFVWYNDSYTCALWSHAERGLGNVSYAPFFAAVYAPWTVSLAVYPQPDNATRVDATVTCVPRPVFVGAGV